jgi:predicted membrane channel-forming protein YqfA (hemolysin III family)
MYTPLLFLHSWVRWVVLALGLVAVARAATGVRTRRPHTPLDESSARQFTIAMDVQFLLGLLLYVWASPFTTEAFADFGAAMRNPQLRFFVVEHVFGMVVALAFAHVGRARLKRAADSPSRHRTALIFFGLSLLSMLVSIPWPGMPAGRPLLRGF